MAQPDSTILRGRMEAYNQVKQDWDVTLYKAPLQICYAQRISGRLVWSQTNLFSIVLVLDKIRLSC